MDIEAPSSVDDLLKQHLEIMRWLNSPRMNTAEWHRMLQATPRNIEDLLATEGYLSPQITQNVSTSTEGNNGQDIRQQATFSVDPGPPSVIKEVAINFTGEITRQAADIKPTPESLRENWSLKPGMRFSQDRWNSAKRSLLGGLILQRYPAAHISKSLAEIDAASNEVRLELALESGQPYRFGEVEVYGLQRYPRSV